MTVVARPHQALPHGKLSTSSQTAQERKGQLVFGAGSEKRRTLFKPVDRECNRHELLHPADVRRDHHRAIGDLQEALGRLGAVLEREELGEVVAAESDVFGLFEGGLEDQPLGQAGELDLCGVKAMLAGKREDGRRGNAPDVLNAAIWPTTRRANVNR